MIAEVLGGPSVQHVRRLASGAVTATGCRAHSCDEKGFFLYDPTRDLVVAGIGHYFFNTEDYTRTPNILIVTSAQSCDDLTRRDLDPIASWAKQAYPGGFVDTRCVAKDETLRHPFTTLTAGRP